MKFRLFSKIGGNFEPVPSAVRLSENAEKLLTRALNSMGRYELRDYHAHVIGIGTGNTGCFVHPKMRSWLNPVEHARFRVLASASGIIDLDRADQQYVERLVALASDFPVPVKFGLLAIDKHYKKDGTPDLERTLLYTPNEYVYEISRQYPHLFFPCVSIHPYRKDALDELDKWGELGVKQVKWLPNEMGMNPASTQCLPFYEKMKHYGMTLLVHTGREQTIQVKGFHRYSNPLLLRVPLDAGVKVIAAHCASLGKHKDLENPDKPRTESYRLFLRLMKERKYENLLFADIAVITQAERAARALKPLLAETSLHPRLVNGSDYPLPAVNALVSTRALENMGFLTARQRRALNEIYRKNPLLFDFAVKRTVAHPETGEQFGESVFLRSEGLGY